MKKFTAIATLTFVTLAHITFAQNAMRAHFINVGQGSATLLEFSCGVILIDVGGENNKEFNGKEKLNEYLANFFDRRGDLNNTIDLLVLTHPHTDHTSGVKDVAGSYVIRNVITNGMERGSGRYNQIFLHEAITAADLSAETDDDIGYFESAITAISQAGANNAVIDPFADCSGIDPVVTVLWGNVPRKPSNWKAADFENINNHSVVIRVDFGKSSILVTGDLEDVAIDKLVQKFGESDLLDSDVYVAGHHGSKNGTTEELLDLVSPEISVMSFGDPERMLMWTAWQYGHPNKTVVDLLQSKTSKVRDPIQALVGTRSKTFTTDSITKAVYGTGWDDDIVFEATVSGDWNKVDEPMKSMMVAAGERSIKIETIGDALTGDDTIKMGKVLAIKLDGEKPIHDLNVMFINGFKANITPFDTSDNEKIAYYHLDKHVAEVLDRFDEDNSERAVVPVTIALGTEDENGAKVMTKTHGFFLEVRPRLKSPFVLMCVMLGIFILTAVALWGNVLKDSTGIYYSLSHTQLFFWTILVAVVYVVVGFRTDILPELSSSILAILGISASTTAVGKIIDGYQTAKIRLVPGAKSEGWLADILSDHGSINVCRFQLVLFNFVFSAIFVQRSLAFDAFPEFDNNVLALMGVSAMTYTGLKTIEPVEQKVQGVAMTSKNFAKWMLERLTALPRYIYNRS